MEFLKNLAISDLINIMGVIIVPLLIAFSRIILRKMDWEYGFKKRISEYETISKLEKLLKSENASNARLESLIQSTKSLRGLPVESIHFLLITLNLPIRYLNDIAEINNSEVGYIKFNRNCNTFVPTFDNFKISDLNSKKYKRKITLKKYKMIAFCVVMTIISLFALIKAALAIDKAIGFNYILMIMNVIIYSCLPLVFFVLGIFISIKFENREMSFNRLNDADILKKIFRYKDK